MAIVAQLSWLIIAKGLIIREHAFIFAYSWLSQPLVYVDWWRRTASDSDFRTFLILSCYKACIVICLVVNELILIVPCRPICMHPLIIPHQGLAMWHPFIHGCIFIVMGPPYLNGPCSFLTYGAFMQSLIKIRIFRILCMLNAIEICAVCLDRLILGAIILLLTAKPIDKIWDHKISN